LPFPSWCFLPSLSSPLPSSSSSPLPEHETVNLSSAKEKSEWETFFQKNPFLTLVGCVLVVLFVTLAKHNTMENLSSASHVSSVLTFFFVFVDFLFCADLSLARFWIYSIVLLAIEMINILKFKWLGRMVLTQ
jgi:hypothetical protein